MTHIGSWIASNAHANNDKQNPGEAGLHHIRSIGRLTDTVQSKRAAEACSSRKLHILKQNNDTLQVKRPEHSLSDDLRYQKHIKRAMSTAGFRQRVGKCVIMSSLLSSSNFDQ